MLKAIANLFKKNPETIQPVVDDLYISLVKTADKYPTGEAKHSLYYQGHFASMLANEWSVVILINDILRSRYDIVEETEDIRRLTNTARSTWSTKYSRHIDFKLNPERILRFHIDYFNSVADMEAYIERQSHIRAETTPFIEQVS